MKFVKFKLIKCQNCHHIETIQLIYSANQLTGFYMMGAMAFKVLRYALNEGNTLFQY